MKRNGVFVKKRSTVDHERSEDKPKLRSEKTSKANIAITAHVTILTKTMRYGYPVWIMNKNEEVQRRFVRRLLFMGGGVGSSIIHVALPICLLFSLLTRYPWFLHYTCFRLLSIASIFFTLD